MERNGGVVTRRWLTRAKIGVIAFVAAAMTPAVGAPRVPAAQPCTVDGAESVTVRSVGADLSLTLMDGRVMRLAGLDPVRETPAHPARPAETRGLLATWLDGHAASVRILATTPDRWGRVPAMVFAPATADVNGPTLSVALALIDAGLARRSAEPEAAACDAEARMAETNARAAGLGLWDDPYYAIRHADDGLPWGDAAGGMVVIEGRVRHVGETRTRIYLDLGPTRGSLAVRLPRRGAFILDQGGEGHGGWIGRSLRIRGVPSEAGGPLLDVQDADQIESMDVPAPDVAWP